MKKLVLALIVLLSIAAFGQEPVINAPQYNVSLAFMTGGPYNQASALDVTFGSQFTTNNRLQADFVTMPSANYSGYLGGNSYDLCGISSVATLLSTTSLSCGKFMPFVTGEAGLGRIQVGNEPSTTGPAGLIGLGVGYDPTGAGHFALLGKFGWGHFGPDVAATSVNPKMSGNGFYYYIASNFGGGQSVSATDAKVDHMKESSRKKATKHLNSACKRGDQVSCQMLPKKADRA
jgi:hypothetical protein